MSTTTIIVISGLTLICSLGFFTITVITEKFLKREKIRIRDYEPQHYLKTKNYEKWR
jgi:hypothetical protein